MGLTNSSVGKRAKDSTKELFKVKDGDKIIALAGNPNVGKSTLFNSLTGMNQHTGNWPGKTVTNAFGVCKYRNTRLVLADLPGTYSLMAHSAEEQTARDFICFGDPDASVIVCDASCLERNLNLVLQTLEVSDNAVVCVNLLDEAKKKGISVDTDLLSEKLGVPVVGTVARKKKTLDSLVNAISQCISAEKNTENIKIPVKYPKEIENAIKTVSDALPELPEKMPCKRWISIKLLENEKELVAEINKNAGFELSEVNAVKHAVLRAWNELEPYGYTRISFCDTTVRCVLDRAHELAELCVRQKGQPYCGFDRKADKILTSKALGFPVMLVLLALVFWITVEGANIPSEMLSGLLFGFEERIARTLFYVGLPEIAVDMLTHGVYRVLAWVVSVMLPPMAIFFPLFTLLEDSGYLPRIAYNLDKPFCKCHACGKQAMTMCMGFGCNAAGIVGCRIIDSPRERLLAILTNSFVPCNGRFPALIAVITMFFACSPASGGVISALMLTLVIVLGILATFGATALLSKTLLKGVPSAFTIELPSYRKPQIGKVLVRSVFDRTLFVLARSVSVAAPAGLVIWLMANVTVGDMTLLKMCSDFLDPLGHLMGLDGVILIAFILGFPANEIVIPIIIMAYMSGGTLTGYTSLEELHTLFVNNGWTWTTAVCMLIFTLMHWPCSTSVLTVHKETGSLKWTLLSVAVPTAAGFVLCTLFNLTVKLVLHFA